MGAIRVGDLPVHGNPFTFDNAGSARRAMLAQNRRFPSSPNALAPSGPTHKRPPPARATTRVSWCNSSMHLRKIELAREQRESTRCHSWMVFLLHWRRLPAVGDKEIYLGEQIKGTTLSAPADEQNIDATAILLRVLSSIEMSYRTTKM